MPNRMIVFVPAILAIVVAAVASTSRSSRAADDCIAKPSSAAPAGSRWYYRADRASRRQCWFLAPEGAKARRAASPKPPPAAQPIPPKVAETPAETAAGGTRVVENQLATALSTRWLELPISAASIGREAPLPGNSYADEDSKTPAQDEMPLVWPVLTGAEVAAAQRQPESTVGSGPTLAVLTGALAIAIMIGCAVFERSAAHRLRRRQRRGRSNSAAAAIGAQGHVQPAFDGTAAASGRHDGVRRSMVAMRRAGAARTPRTPGDPDCDIEKSLRQLLHDWQRLAA